MVASLVETGTDESTVVIVVDIVVVVSLVKTRTDESAVECSGQFVQK